MSHTLTPLSIYEQWQEGELDNRSALELLCRFLSAVTDKLEPLEQSKDQARAWISEVVDRMGGDVKVPGFGELKITSPSVTHTYDKKELDALTMELFRQGEFDLVNRLNACLKTSSRAGGLRITKEK